MLLITLLMSIRA